MVRVGRRGEGRFRRVGWSEAYRTIAEGFARIKAEQRRAGPGALLPRQWRPLLRTLMVAYGSPNYAAPSYAQCKGARDVGYTLTFGEALPSPEPLDFENATAMVLFGSHLGENAHNSQVQELVRARARGADLVVLDPRFSTVADKATLWLPVAPGQRPRGHPRVDPPAPRAMARTTVSSCRATARASRSFAPTCVDTTPAWAAREAGVDESAILRAYEILVKARPAVVVHPGRHVSWYGEADTQRARGQAILTALLGAWWAPGGLFRPERGRVCPTTRAPTSRSCRRTSTRPRVASPSPRR